MTTILHNARCSKSRNCYQILEEKGENFEVRDYIKDPLTKEEIKDLLKKLNMPAEAVVRKTEEIYKENFRGKELSEDEWIDALVAYPRLLQRPIVIMGDKAYVGRDEESIEKIMEG